MTGLLASVRVLFAKNWRVKQRESWLNRRRPTTCGAWLFPPLVTDVVLPLVVILYLVMWFCVLNQELAGGADGADNLGLARRRLQDVVTLWSLPAMPSTSSAAAAWTALPLLLSTLNMTLATLDRPQNRAFLAHLDRVYSGDAALGLARLSALTTVLPVPSDASTNAADAFLESFPRQSGARVFAAFDLRREAARVFLFEDDNHGAQTEASTSQIVKYFRVDVKQKTGGSGGGGNDDDDDDDTRILSLPGVLPLQMELNAFLRRGSMASPASRVSAATLATLVPPERACRLLDTMLLDAGLFWQDLPAGSPLGHGEASCEKALQRGRVPAATLSFLAQLLAFDASLDTTRNLSVNVLPERPKKVLHGQLEANIVFYLAYLFLWPYNRLVRDVVVEKEKQLKEYLLIMGLPPMALLVSWFLVYLVASVVVVGVAVVMLSGTMFAATAASQAHFLLLLMVFAVSMLLFAIAITPVFSSARTAAAAAPLLYLLMSAAPPLRSYLGDEAVQHSALRFVIWFMEQVSSPVVFMEALHEVVALDAVTKRIRPIAWATVAGPSAKMALQSVGYLVLGWYLENVFPRAFGVQQPWYFVVQPSYWFPNRFGASALAVARDTASEDELVSLTAARDEEAASAAFPEDDTMREIPMGEYLHHFRPILLVKALSKRFPNGKLAVNNVSFGVKKGEIFGLLGPNGAGKSTTMSILCGMLAPTAGDAFVGASSVSSDPLSIRKSLSVCFQQNILFDNLTVWEHLKLVYELKTSLGIKAVDEEMWAHKLTHFGLEEKRDALSKTLSGGQKRKLSLILALMDTSRVVLLDEPTAGMDLKARVDTWDALKKAVNHRAVILTTHSMQEAQALCENIGIVAEGKLKCCGSSLFLREKFGVGYKLTVVHCEDTAAGGNHAEPILAVVKKHVPMAVLVSENKWETRIQLNDDEPATLLPIFGELETMKKSGLIRRYAVAATDLEDVFVRVTEGGDVYYHVKDGEEDAAQAKADAKRSGTQAMGIPSDGARHSDLEAVPLQLWAMLLKRWKLMVRDKRAFLAHYAWPLVFFVVLLAIGSGMPVGNNYLETTTDLPVTASHSSLFVGTLPGASAAAKQIFDHLDPQVKSRLRWEEVATPAQLIDTILHNDTATSYFGAVLIRNATLADATASARESPLFQFSIYYNETIAHSMPVALQWMETAYCKTLQEIESGGDCELSFTKSAFPRRSIFSSKAGASNDGDGGASIQVDAGKSNDVAQRFIVAFYILITLSSITSNYITAVVKERETGLKRLQYLHLASERASLVYWVSHLVYDYIGFIVSLVVLFVVMAAYGMGWTGDLMVALAVLSLAFGLASLAFSYLLSLAFSSHSSAQSVMSYVASFQVLANIVMFSLSFMPNVCAKIATVAFFLRLLPLYAYGEALLNLASKDLALLRTQCVSTSQAQGEGDAMGGGLFGLGDGSEVSPWDWTVSGRPLAYLVGSFVAYMALLFNVDAMQSYPTILKNRLDWVLRRQPAHTRTYQPVAHDVESPSRDVIEVQHLTKVYNPKKAAPAASGEANHEASTHSTGEEDRPVLNQNGQVVAVDDVSFVVERNDCVALLGVNGSGKSTTFEVLTSGIAPTVGSARIDGIDVTLQPRLASRQYGYCPQTNIQFAELSVREHLQFFYRLRTRLHYTTRIEEAVLQNLMTKLDLHQVENTTAGHLSGGNKRRLMLALSLLSDEVALLLMDEPSAGVDVVARRLMWKVLYEKRQGNREVSCLFTTHSMEEAEAVCANAVVLNKGKLVWNGSIPELKHHASSGISITLRLDTARIWEAERVRYLVDKIRAMLSHGGAAGSKIAADELQSVWATCRELTPRTKGQAASTQEQQWIAGLIARVQQEHGTATATTTTSTTATTAAMPADASPASMEPVDFVQEWLLREAFATIETQLFQELVTARSGEPVKPVALHNALGSGTNATAVYETNCNAQFALVDAFTTLETHKAAFAIARYSVSELSLERVFEQFT